MKLLTAVYVGRKKPITDLTPDQQQKIQQAYKDTGWATDYSEEGICIVIGEDAEETAKKICANKPGYHYMALPINQPLPETTADFLGTQFASSSQPALLLNARVVNLNDVVQATEVAVEATRRAIEGKKRENVTLATLVNETSV